MIDEYLDEINLKIRHLKEQIGQAQSSHVEINSRNYGLEHIHSSSEGYLYLIDDGLAAVLRYEQLDPGTFLITDIVSREEVLRMKLFYIFADYLMNYTIHKNDPVIVASPDELSDRIFEERGFQKERWSWRQFIRDEKEYRFIPSSQR